LQELIEAEATARIGAEWGERTDTRPTLRNGYREKTVTTQAGDLELAIPKLRAGSFFPSLLERRRRIDQALYAVIMEAYVHGVSTRSVDDLVKALGSDTGISKSEVSRICADLDEQLEAFRTRPLEHTRFPYVYLDATYVKARVHHRILSQAVVIATGVTEDGGREVLGVMVGDSETEAFWTEFLRSLRERGLRRCPSRHLRQPQRPGQGHPQGHDRGRLATLSCPLRPQRLLGDPEGSRGDGRRDDSTLFAQPTAETVRAHLDTVADMLGEQFPKVKEMLLTPRPHRS
jgi:hypothetical protein